MRPTCSLCILFTLLCVTSCLVSTKKNSSNAISSTASSILSPLSSSIQHSSHSSIATMLSSSKQKNTISSDLTISSSNSSISSSLALSSQIDPIPNTSSTIALSSINVSSSSKIQVSSSGNLYTLKEIVVIKQQLFQAVYTPPDACSTVACIQAKAEYDIASLNLKNAVKSGTFSSSYRTHQQLSIGALTPTKLKYMFSEYICKNGSSGGSYREFNYSVSNGTLEIDYDDYCTKEHYTGSSNDIYGIWNLTRTEEYKAPNSGKTCWWDWDDHRIDTHRKHKTLTITHQQITIDEQIEYNCLYDDFISKWSDDFEFISTKVDCNTHSYEEGDGLIAYATNERIDGSFIESYRYEYEDQSCSWANERNVNDTTNTVCTSDLPKKPQAERPCTDFFESFCSDSQSTIDRCK